MTIYQDAPNPQAQRDFAPKRRDVSRRAPVPEDTRGEGRETDQEIKDNIHPKG